LSGLTFLFIGVVVFVLKPDNQSSWVFLIACGLLAVYTITSFDVQTTHAGLIRLYLFVNTFFPAAFIHLSLLFPQRWKLVDRHPNIQIIPYIVSLATVIPLEMLYPAPGFVSVYQWVRMYTIISAVFVMGSAVKAYVERLSVLARQRAKVVVFGALIAFPITAIAHYISLFGGDSVSLRIDNNFLALPLIAFPASIAFAIARHNLFDVDVYIKRAVGYVMMTMILATGYLSIQTVTGRFVFRPLFGDLADEAYPIAFALLVVFFFNPINRRIQEVIDRVFFRKALDYKETVRSVSSALTSLLNLDQILERVVQTVRQEMFIDTVGLVVLDRQKEACQSYFADDEVERDIKINPTDRGMDYNDPLLALLSKEKALITKYDIREDPRYGDLRESCGRSFADLGASLALPLIYQGEVTGVLILGNKKSGQFYSRDDVDLLDTMADEAAVAIENAKLAEQMKKEESARANLARYLSPQIVDQIIKNDVQVNLGGDKKVVTVLFSDIRNFTTITEMRDPEELVRQLNEYFTEMANIIFEYGGSLDKYIGDAIVAVFGSLIDLENPAHNAAQAATKMMRQLLQLNDRWAKEYGLRMEIGIGLSTGEVFLGNIGSPERMEFTVIGDTVNVASRFSGLAKPGQILMTKEVVLAIGREVTVNALSPVEVKGKSGEVEVFELVKIG
jgi:adenylate cyclase